jgi:hypothetical protein
MASQVAQVSAQPYNQALVRHGLIRAGIRGFSVAAAVLLAFASAASAASPAAINGKLESAAAKLPKSAKAGSAQVLAMNVDTAAYGDADNVGRNGRYSLRLPPGKWALLTSTVMGGRYRSFLSAAIVTKSGQKRTLPALKLRKYRKPRRRRGRHRKPKHPHGRSPSAGKSNVNPRDGRPYRGVAYAFKEFDVTSSDGELGMLRRGMPEMLTTDVLASRACPFTIVEWMRRDEVIREIEMEQTQYFDPATRVEPGHLIDPEVFIRGRVEDRPGSPPRHATVVWLEDAKTGARISGDVSVVGFDNNVFAAEQRLAKLVIRDLICARRPTPGEETPPPPPKPVSDVYQGTFSGSADAAEGALHFHWSGNVRMDAAQDLSVPPPGGPPGDYRIFSVTTGGVHIDLSGSAGECVLSGSGDFPLGPSNGYLWVQLEADHPAYFLNITYSVPIIQVEKSGGEECEEEFPLPAFGILAETKEARSSPSTTLSDSESHSSSEGTGFDYTTSWSLSPG